VVQKLGAAVTAPQFKLLTPEDVEALPDLEWLINGILPAGSIGVLYGEPGCGKTFVALSMALAIASGRDWQNRATRKVMALYVAAEGVLGLKKRIQAYRQRFKLADDNIRFIATPISILDAAQIKSLLVLLKEQGFEPGIIVIDTLARVALGADENSAKDMGQVVEGFDELRRQTEATILVIHHTRKD
jgi:RecA-family ATPase